MSEMPLHGRDREEERPVGIDPFSFDFVDPEIVRHDEMESLAALAPVLKANAVRRKITWWNQYPRLASVWIRWKLGMSLPRFHRECNLLFGLSELSITLSYRTHMELCWHLSVLPCRFGVLFSWERKMLTDAFEIRDPVVTVLEGSHHWFWK